MGLERRKYLDGLPGNLSYEQVDVVKIGDKLIGKDQPVFVIAEVGANHRGKIENALKAIELAADFGADAVKFQHLTHDKIAADTVVYDSWNGKKIGPLSSFYQSAELPNEWTEKLISHAKKCGVMFLSTPFDTDAVDILAKADVPAFKVASYEMTDDLLLGYIAKKGKPIILSTGMAYLEEVAHAVRVIQENGNNQIVLLHCVSIYPPKSFADLNLRAIQTLKDSFKLPVGYSDHSKPPYYAAPIAAVALGACVIEKHFTDERKGGSNDDPNSLMPEEFRRTVEEIRNAELALSKEGIKQPVIYPGYEGDEIADRWARRSIYAIENIPAGAILTKEMITTLRPWGGIAPKDIDLILGKKVLRLIPARSAVTLDYFFEK